MILVDRLGREDDPVDVEKLVPAELLHLADDLDVDVGEQLELAPRGVGEPPDADDERPLPRDDPARASARARKADRDHDGEAQLRSATGIPGEPAGVKERKTIVATVARTPRGE